MKRREFLQLGLTGVGAAALAGKARALEYYPKPSPKKWAVIYSTWCGSSRDAGVWVSEGMGGIADVFDVKENPDLKTHEHIVLGSSIRGGKINPLMERYIRENRNLMKGKVRGLYAICWNGQKPPGPEQKKKYIDDQLARFSGAAPVPARVFIGRITLGLLDEEPRGILSRMGAQDFDDLKRTDCLAFGKEILASTG